MPLYSPDKIRRLLAVLPAEEALRQGPEELQRIMGGDLDSARRLRDMALAFDAERELEEEARLGIRLIAWDDPEFPESLLWAKECPLVIYAQGDVTEGQAAAAVVGSRGPSPYGRRVARLLAGDLARRGVTIVSGLARGIDSEAHEAALSCRGRTWAVLGGGLQRVYPPENVALARRIVDSGGCVLSELALRASPNKLNFIRRNRLVAALGWAVVVVEGRERSGASITAHDAAELGRDVFAVPGPVDSPLSDLPHGLLKAGARPACSAEDVLASLDAGRRLALGAAAPRPPRRAASLSLEYSKILQYIGCEAVTVDALAAETGLELPRLSNILFEMELQGLISPFPGQRYAKKVL